MSHLIDYDSNYQLSCFCRHKWDKFFFYTQSDLDFRALLAFFQRLKLSLTSMYCIDGHTLIRTATDGLYKKNNYGN